MRGFDHATILSPSFHGLRKERLAQWPAFCVPKKRPKVPEWVLPEKLGGSVRHAYWNPYPISDQNLWFSLPYFRPDQKFDTLFQTWSPGARRVTSCYGTYTVGVNIKREMVLSPNDEEVASSKNIPNWRLKGTNHTLFQTTIVEIIPYFRPKRLQKHTLWRRTYLYSRYKGVPPPPPGWKTRRRLWVSLLTQARL